MKIRECRISNFRNFRGDSCIRFDDALTGQVRPISLLVGSNGSGKTTLFSLIQGLLETVTTKDLLGPGRVLPELWRSGFGAMQVEVDMHTAATFGLSSPFWIACGKHMPAYAKDMGNIAGTLPLDWEWVSRDNAVRLMGRILGWYRAYERDRQTLRDGLLHFPHNRWFAQAQMGSIEPASIDTSWIWQFEPSSQWQGSLAQLWVWQNYLDLEQQSEGRPNLAPFVEVIEEILGEGRKISIRQGRVRIKTPYGTQVEPHELPSGEQQILMMFGELARRLRPGAVILIDEVEISLHPALQRKVLHHFRRLAQKYDLQFILTTHSLDLVRAVAPHEVVNLDNMALEAESAQAERS